MDDAYPHPSAFTRDDISELVKWVRGGRSLLLIIDHAPVPGAAADLGAVLGINMLDGHAQGHPPSFSQRPDTAFAFRSPPSGRAISVARSRRLNPRALQSP